MTCIIEGCNRERGSRDWCHTHYKRWLRSGDPRGTRSIDAQADRIEDARFMAEMGESLDGAARRMGMSTEGLRKLLQRAREDATLAALNDHQPHDHNSPANRTAVVRARRVAA